MVNGTNMTTPYTNSVIIFLMLCHALLPFHKERSSENKKLLFFKLDKKLNHSHIT